MFLLFSCFVFWQEVRLTLSSCWEYQVWGSQPKLKQSYFNNLLLFLIFLTHRSQRQTHHIYHGLQNLPVMCVLLSQADLNNTIPLKYWPFIRISFFFFWFNIWADLLPSLASTILAWNCKYKINSGVWLGFKKKT